MPPTPAAASSFSSASSLAERALFRPASLTTFTRSAVFRARTGRRLTSVGPAVVEKHLATHSAAAYLFNHVAQGARALVVCKRRRDTSPAGCVFIGCSAVAKLRQPAAPLWGLPGPLALALRGGPRQNASTASWGQPRAWICQGMSWQPAPASACVAGKV